MSLNTRPPSALQASCPARIDIGNSLDFPSFFYSLPARKAYTTNIAVDLRTTVSWSPTRNGHVSIYRGHIKEHYRGIPDPEKSRLPLICALLRHFEVSSGIFRVVSQVPLGSGLGGSGLLTVALLALMKYLHTGRVSERDFNSLVLSAHFFENWLGFSSTGFHDQLAAVYGGAHIWNWGTHMRGQWPVFKKKPVMPAGGPEELSRKILVCFTGQAHSPNTAGSRFQSLPLKDIPKWSAVSEHARHFGLALRQSNWVQAAWHLNEECKLREELSPGCLSSRARTLICKARQVGVGARYAGYGSGGTVWACGDKDAVAATKRCWRRMCGQWKGAWVKQPDVAGTGLVIS